MDIDRRTFAAGVAFLGMGGAYAQSSTTVINVVKAIKALRTSDAFYAIAPGSTRYNWYFTNLGLTPIVRLLSPTELDFYVRVYLDNYLARLKPNFTIDDFDGLTPVASDSDDSYAATTLTLAVRYARAASNTAWWSANVAKLKGMAYYNLVVMVKANGLTSVFQPPRNAQNNTGYLMDNCEAYRGLRDFAQYLRETGDVTDANYYDSFAAQIGNAINSQLFVSSSSGFKPGDTYTGVETGFYPGTTCQVFPQVFGVVECAARFNAAYAYLNLYSPQWPSGLYDAFPWAALGTCAAKRGDTTRAQQQQAMTERKFVSQRTYVTINELGFYQQTKSLLSGQPAV